MPVATLTIKNDDQTIICEGDWRLMDPPAVLPPLEALMAVRQVDLTNIGQWDSTLVAFVWNLGRDQQLYYTTQIPPQPPPPTLQVIGAPNDFYRLLGLTTCATAEAPLPPHPRLGRREKAAQWYHHSIEALKSSTTFLGEIFISLGRLARRKIHYRPNDWLWEFVEAGPRALPIVVFISFLVGLIVAFVSSIQLKMFGASIYVADLVGLSMTREMGALMTAIIMAGRTGAAYAAQIGTMKRSEELDALRTMGLSPMDMVVLPRVVALTVMMPILAIFAAFVGIFAGLIVADGNLGISPFQYLGQLSIAVGSKDFLIGVIKAIVYGFLVAFAGAWRGFRARNSADGVGAAATSAVVLSITLIVFANAIFAILLNALKL